MLQNIFSRNEHENHEHRQRLHVKQETLADAKVSARQHCVHEGP